MVWRVTCLISLLLAPFSLRAGVFFSPAKGNIFPAEGGEVTFKPEHPESIASGKILLRDERGREIAGMVIPPAAVEVAIPLSGRGYYAIDAEVADREGKTKTFSTTAAVIGPLIDDSERRRSHLGLWNVHGDADLAIAAGANWNRQMTSLRKLPPSILEKNDTPLTNFNSSSPSLTNVGVITAGLPEWILEPLPQTDGQPSSHALGKPKDWEKLRRLIKAWVEANAAKFPPYLEIYNEPEWAWKGRREDLVRFLALIAETVKKARPEVQVLGPGFSSIRIEDPARLDLVTVEKLGLLDLLDGIVLHAYVDGSPPEEEFISRVQDLQGYLRKIGKGALPIHFTEFGWTSKSGTWQRPVSELTQAEYAARSLTLLTALGVENATYFCMLFRTKNEGEHGFSLLHDDQTPKPGYAAYANVARWLAGVDGKGEWLRITPTTHLVLFRKGERFIGVAWDTAGERALALPAPVDRVSDFLGRPLASGGEITISPSPVFFEFAKGESFQIEPLPVRQVMRGDSLTLPDGDGAWIVPEPLRVTGGMLTVPAQTREGNYLALAKSGGHWRSLPIDVIPPLQVARVVLKWPAESAAAALEAPAKSFAKGPLLVRAAAHLDGTRDRFLDLPEMEPGAQTTLQVPLEDLELGRRYTGQLSVVTKEGEHRDRIEQPLDFTLLACAHSEGEPKWEKIPPVDFSAWDPFGKIKGAEDCSATLQSAYNAAGLQLRIRGRDDAHVQDRPPAQLWTQDGLQIGLDPDYEKTWEANDLFGLKGHRAFEYGIGWNGRQVMTWRWISYLPELPPNAAEPRIKATVTREGDVTDYQITFPWAVLGLSAAPQPGTAIGISLAVTDADPGQTGRRGLRLFGGITDGKDPQKYGPLWLR